MFTLLLEGFLKWINYGCWHIRLLDATVCKHTELQYCLFLPWKTCMQELKAAPVSDFLSAEVTEGSIVSLKYYMQNLDLWVTWDKNKSNSVLVPVLHTYGSHQEAGPVKLCLTDTSVLVVSLWRKSSDRSAQCSRADQCSWALQGLMGPQSPGL